MNTQKTKEIVLLEKKVNQFEIDISDLKIIDDETMLKAAEKRKEIKSYLNEAVKIKKEATDPLNGVLKTIRGWFLPIEEKAENSITYIEIRMSKYQNEVDAKRLKAERDSQEKIDKANAELEKGKISEKQAEKIIERAETKVEKVPEVITKSDSFHTRINRNVRFIEPIQLGASDLRYLVDHEYIVWNTVKGRKDALAGISVPGTSIYEEKTFV